ncbi:MAG: Rieske 2Fe-2S domain-containing protein [Betaproteobacteria bacterium]
MSKVLVCKTADIPDNGMKGFALADGKRVLIAQSAGCYYAYQGMCPHQEVFLDEGFYDGTVLTCHQHLWQWDIASGDAVGLAEAPLERYALEVDDGALYVVQTSALSVAGIFAGVSASTLTNLNELSHREEFDGGSALYEIGDPANDIYILESGRVEFLLGRDGRGSPSGFMLRKGELFGWNALLEHQPNRIAKASCLEKSVVLRLGGNETLKVLEADPASGYRVMRNLSNLIARYLTVPGAT